MYCDIGIKLNNKPNDVLSLSESSGNHQKFDKSDTLEEDENPLDLCRFISQDTMFLSNMTRAEETSIAPGEGKELISILNDKYCEDLAVPCLFPKRKFGYKVERKIKLSQSNILTSVSLIIYTYLPQLTTQELKIQNQISIVMKNVCSGHLTAGMLS